MRYSCLRPQAAATLAILTASALWEWGLVEARVLGPRLPIFGHLKLSLPTRNIRRSSEVAATDQRSSLTSSTFESSSVQDFLLLHTDPITVSNLHDIFVNLYTQQLYTKLSETSQALPPYFIPLIVYGAFETGSINYYCPSPVFYIIKVCSACPIVPVHSENNTIIPPPTQPQISSQTTTLSANNVTYARSGSHSGTGTGYRFDTTSSISLHLSSGPSSIPFYSTVSESRPIVTDFPTSVSSRGQPFYPHHTSIRFTNHSSTIAPTQYSSVTYASSGYFLRSSQTLQPPYPATLPVESRLTPYPIRDIPNKTTANVDATSAAYTTATVTVYGLVSIGSVFTSAIHTYTHTGPASLVSSLGASITSPPAVAGNHPAPVQTVVPPVIAITISAPPCASSVPAFAAYVTYVAIVCNACSGTPPAACPTVTVISTELIGSSPHATPTQLAPATQAYPVLGTSDVGSLYTSSTSGVQLISALSTSTTEGRLPSYAPGPKYTYSFYNSTIFSSPATDSELPPSSSTAFSLETAPITTGFTSQTTASTSQAPSTTHKLSQAAVSSTVYQPCPVCPLTTVYLTITGYATTTVALHTGVFSSHIRSKPTPSSGFPFSSHLHATPSLFTPSPITISAPSYSSGFPSSSGFHFTPPSYTHSRAIASVSTSSTLFHSSYAFHATPSFPNQTVSSTSAQTYSAGHHHSSDFHAIPSIPYQRALTTSALNSTTSLTFLSSSHATPASTSTSRTSEALSASYIAPFYPRNSTTTKTTKEKPVSQTTPSDGHVPTLVSTTSVDEYHATRHSHSSSEAATSILSSSPALNSTKTHPSPSPSSESLVSVPQGPHPKTTRSTFIPTSTQSSLLTTKTSSPSPSPPELYLNSTICLTSTLVKTVILAHPPPRPFSGYAADTPEISNGHNGHNKENEKRGDESNTPNGPFPITTIKEEAISTVTIAPSTCIVSSLPAETSGSVEPSGPAETLEATETSSSISLSEDLTPSQKYNIDETTSTDEQLALSTVIVSPLPVETSEVAATSGNAEPSSSAIPLSEGPSPAATPLSSATPSVSTLISSSETATSSPVTGPTPTASPSLQVVASAGSTFATECAAVFAFGAFFFFAIGYLGGF